MDTNLALEIGFVVKDVVVLAESLDWFLGLPLELFDVLDQFAETLTNVR